MGAFSYGVTALAALGLAMTVGAQEPRPGTLETYKDWTIGCDNRNRCQAAALLPQDGAIPENPLMIGVAREAGPGGGTEVWASRDARGSGVMRFVVDGRMVATAQSQDGEAAVRGAQADALAIALARGSVLEVRDGTRLLGKPSLAGAGAALRYMDARQGRAGTTTALVATGPLGANAVRPVPVPVTIRRAVIPALPTPAPLWREE